MRAFALPLRVASLGALAANGPPAPDEAAPNDNRRAAGRMTGDTLVLHLDARVATWRPDLDVDSLVHVMAFAEEGAKPTIPGPLVRVPQGTHVRVSLRNSLDTTLVVHGLRAGPFESDTVRLAPGVTRVVHWRTDSAGTFLYWGTTTGSRINDRPWRDSQLAGAIVVDPAGGPVDTTERLFVITVLDVYKGDTARNRTGEDIWELAINGRSWPHTERLDVPVGTTARWRWVNASYLPHPMHLHGFHFVTTAKGERNAYREYASDERPTVVTELMRAGSTFAMEWTPTRAGHWLMHCHMIPHITPFPERADTVAQHDAHDLASHPMKGMSGLILGITTSGASDAMASGDAAAAPASGASAPMRLFAQQKRAKGRTPVPHGFVLQRGGEPAADSVEVPGTPILLERGRQATITVVNRLGRATTVHWHGMELESVFDGVAGWSRTGTAMAPLLAPGDSFTVRFTPPRAGTFIYHTHIDEGPQLGSGMYGPLLVLERGERYDPARDLTFMIGTIVERDTVRVGINGRSAPPPRTLRVGVPYRFRIVNIHPADPATVSLRRDSVGLTWRPLAKDGADLPPRLVTPRAATLVMGVGETADYEVVFDRPGDAVLEVRMLPMGQAVQRFVIR